MALARKCDLCGAYYDFYNVHSDPNCFTFVNVNDDNEHLDLEYFDLCPNCLEELTNKVKKLKGVNQSSSKDQENYKLKYDTLKIEFDHLVKRFNHLISSKFINSFDEWDLKKNDYKRDIKEADELVNRFIEMRTL